MARIRRGNGAWKSHSLRHFLAPSVTRSPCSKRAIRSPLQVVNSSFIEGPSTTLQGDLRGNNLQDRSRHMLMNTSKVLLVAVLLTVGMLHTNAQQSVRTPMACADLTGLTFEGNTSITSA